MQNANLIVIKVLYEVIGLMFGPGEDNCSLIWVVFSNKVFDALMPFVSCHLECIVVNSL